MFHKDQRGRASIYKTSGADIKLRNRCSCESTGPYADKNAASLRMAQRHNEHKDKGLEYSPGE
jgi:hypothetical protein